MFSTTDKWNSYIPANTERWWEVGAGTERGRLLTKQATYVTESREYVPLISKIIADTPNTPSLKPITSVLKPASGVGGYLYYIVTEDDLKPKVVPKKAKTEIFDSQTFAGWDETPPWTVEVKRVYLPSRPGEPLAEVVYEGKLDVDTMDEGVRAFSNRQYKFLNVPFDLRGLKFIRHAGGAHKGYPLRVLR